MATPHPYGGEHQRRRKLAVWEAYNTPCPRCGRTMRRGQKLDFAHADEDLAMNPAAKATEIQHASCNRKDGLLLGQRIRDLNPSRIW